MTRLCVDIPEIQTERLTLRAVCEADHLAIAAFYSGPRSRFVGGPVTRADAWRMISGNLGHWLLRGYGMWVLEERATEQPCGICGFIFRDGWDEPELGWQVWDGHEGKGLAFEAASAARAYGARHFGLNGVISYIDPANKRSQALAARLGAGVERDGILLDHAVQVWRHPKEALQ